MRRAALGLLLALSASLTVPALAQEPPSPTEYDWTGRLTFPDTVLVAAGEVLRVAPGTTVGGNGRILVEGSLFVNGTADAPVTFGLPVQLVGQGASSFRHMRFVDVNDTALNVSAGRASLENVSFSGNSRALRVAGDGRVELRDGNVTDHVGEAIYAEGAASVVIDRTTFARNGRGLAVYSASRLEISDSTFRGNEQHLVLDLWPWSVTGRFTLRGNDFLAPTPGAEPLPAIELRHDGSLAQEQPRQVIVLTGNRIEGAPVGLRAEGRALVVESEDDAFVGNQLGVSVQLASVTLRRPTLDNVRDLDGTIVLVDALTPGDEAPTVVIGEPTSTPWMPWALGAIAVLAIGSAFAVAFSRVRRREAPGAKGRGRAPPRERPSVRDPVVRPSPAAPSPSSSPSGPALADEPEPPAAPTRTPAPTPRRVDLETPITSLERRILEDILANPGTSQRAVADRLGYTRQALHYHVKRLEARGLVQKTIEGRETKCAVPAEVARALSTPAVTQTGSQEKG